MASVGRAPVTSVEELSHIGLELFIERGFEATTIDDIAGAAGIGRRTFFRYFSTKNDVPWGDFDALTGSMRERLAAASDDQPLVEVLRVAIIDFNRYPPEEQAFHRARMDLLLNVPSLVAHSTLRYTSWRHVVAEYAARRLGIAPDGLAAQTIAWATLATCLAAYESWLRDPDADLADQLDQAFDVLSQTFST